MFTLKNSGYLFNSLHECINDTCVNLLSKRRIFIKTIPRILFYRNSQNRFFKYPYKIIIISNYSYKIIIIKIKKYAYHLPFRMSNTELFIKVVIFIVPLFFTALLSLFVKDDALSQKVSIKVSKIFILNDGCSNFLCVFQVYPKNIKYVEFFYDFMNFLAVLVLPLFVINPFPIKLCINE